MKRPNPFSFASNGRKRPRTTSCETGQLRKQTSMLTSSFLQHTPSLLEGPRYDHVQLVTHSRIEPAKSELCALLTSFRSAARITSLNNDVWHCNETTDRDLQWNESQDTIQLDLPAKSSPDETYWSEMLMLFTSLLSILIGYYISF